MLLDAGMPGIPALFPRTIGMIEEGHWDRERWNTGFWSTFPATQDLATITYDDIADAVGGAAATMRGWRPGTLGGVPCIWIPPSTPAYRVQPAGLPRALHASQRRGQRFYVVLGGMSYALVDNNAGAGQLELLRMTAAEVASLPGTRQLIIDEEPLRGGHFTRDELFPARHPVFSRNKEPGSNFTLSAFACDLDLVPLDPDRAWTVD